jgi:hypothetical protein
VFSPLCAMAPKKSKSKRAVAQDLCPQEPFLPFGVAGVEEQFKGGLPVTLQTRRTRMAAPPSPTPARSSGMGQGMRGSSFASSWWGWSRQCLSSSMPC